MVADAHHTCTITPASVRSRSDRVTLIGSYNPEVASVYVAPDWEDISLDIMRVVLQDEVILDDLRYNAPFDTDLPGFEAIAKMGLPRER